MKKVVSLFLSLILLFCCSCGISQNAEYNTEETDTEKFFCGIWISYTELNEFAKGDFKESFEEAVNNAKEIGATALFVHVRAMCDSIYPSAFFPLSAAAKNLSFDAMGFMIECCHNNGLEFHAWINPYRISSYISDLNKIDESSPAHTLSHCIGQTEKGLYFDPSQSEARKLVIDGIREIVNRYDVDGIHFDDYFYPTDSEAFDNLSYNKYRAESKKPLPLAYWRRANVNALISGVSILLNNCEKQIEFSVSPAADIDNNENKLYADVDYWCQNGYIDTVIPQLYFGFDYPNEKFRFENLLFCWIDYVGNTGAKLYIGLAPYKIDTDSKNDQQEWENGVQIISRQITMLKNNNAVNGISLFSYSYLFSKGENIEEQKENIKKALKE